MRITRIHLFQTRMTRIYWQARITRMADADYDEARGRMIGRQVTLSDQGEGWFTGYADVCGVVESVIASNRDDNPYYVVRLGSPLELQELGAAPRPASFSGAIRIASSISLARRRHQLGPPVSVHLLLGPTGTPVPKTMADIVHMSSGSGLPVSSHGTLAHKPQQPNGNAHSTCAIDPPRTFTAAARINPRDPRLDKSA